MGLRTPQDIPELSNGSFRLLSVAINIPVALVDLIAAPRRTAIHVFSLPWPGGAQYIRASSLRSSYAVNWCRRMLVETGVRRFVAWRIACHDALPDPQQASATLQAR
jgi:hypothetical protein